jgi:hypothetical protein
MYWSMKNFNVWYSYKTTQLTQNKLISHSGTATSAMRKQRDERSNLWKWLIIPTSIMQMSMLQICQDKSNISDSSTQTPYKSNENAWKILTWGSGDGTIVTTRPGWKIKYSYVL